MILGKLVKKAIGLSGLRAVRVAGSKSRKVDECSVSEKKFVRANIDVSRYFSREQNDRT